MIRRYYEDEIRYLYQAGKEFAKAHPEQARYLHIDSESKDDRDPYVERLSEGFAFLAGRIHERLDDELPEFAEALFNLLWPHFLKPIPALAILEFRPRPGMVQQTTPFPPGMEVRSGPIGEEAAICRFRTTQEVRLQPMALEEAALTWPPDGKSLVSLRFKLERGSEYQKLQLSPLRLFFNAEDAVASMMHLFFTRHVEKVVIAAGDAKATLPGAQWVRAVGFGADEGIVPYSPYSFSGFRLLQEYLSFRQKFWFVDLLGFERFSPPPKTDTFQVQIFLNRAYPEDKRFRTENIRLFCAPIVNLFNTDSEPIRVDHLATEYRVIPDIRHRQSVEVYSIDAVVGTEEGTGERHEYFPFFSFKHDGGKAGRYYTATTRLGPAERYETSIAPGGFKIEDDAPQSGVETLSLEVTCTNGNLPRELPAKAITQPGPDFSNIATFENLTQPRLALYPPLAALRAGQAEKNFLWKLISHLSFNGMSIASLEALRGLFELYDWTGTDANRRRLDGIKSLSWVPKETIQRGAILRGTQVTLEILADHFTDEGDICLFGKVMSEFFSMYATINSFVHLTIVTKPSEARYEWRPTKGVLPVV